MTKHSLAGYCTYLEICGQRRVSQRVISSPPPIWWSLNRSKSYFADEKALLSFWWLWGEIWRPQQ